MSLWSCNECSGIHDQWGKAVVRIDWRRALALLEAGQGGDVNEIRHGRTILYQAVLDREVAAIEALLMLERSGGFPLPRDMISVVCAFWLRVGEYHPDTNALIDFC